VLAAVVVVSWASREKAPWNMDFSFLAFPCFGAIYIWLAGWTGLGASSHWEYMLLSGHDQSMR
jgi:hypothetical protein